MPDRTPLVSVITPVSAVHCRHVRTALASCLWQAVPDWEALVINDGCDPIIVPNDPRIRIIDAPSKPGKRRPAVARNAGIEAARGLFTIFLDADDYLLPSAIETFLRGHARHDKAYSYGHHYSIARDGREWAMYRPPDYNREPRAGPKSHSTAGANPVPTMQGCNLHPITALVPTWCLREVGGFDEDAPGFEDWTIWLRLAQAGYCGERIYGPVFVYRIHDGQQHRPDAAGGQALMDAVTAPYRINRTGDIPMAPCGCGGGAQTAKQMARQLAETFGSAATADNGQVVLEYIGPGQGTQTLRHPGSKREYRAGNNPARQFIVAPPEDAEYLLGLGLFQRQAAPAPFVPPPLVEDEPAPHWDLALDQRAAPEIAPPMPEQSQVDTSLLTPAAPVKADRKRPPDTSKRPRGMA